MRKHVLHVQINDKSIRVYGLHKRGRPTQCEVCEQGNRKLYYHHWDDHDLNKGLWLCFRCHIFAEGIDAGLIDRYLKLKAELDTKSPLQVRLLG